MRTPAHHCLFSPKKRFPPLTQTWLLTQIQAHTFTGPVENENRGTPCSEIIKNPKRVTVTSQHRIELRVQALGARVPWGCIGHTLRTLAV